MSHLPFDIVLLGAQGSGKGTQGRILSMEGQIPFFEMGVYLRNIVKNKTLDPVYRDHIADFINSGKLVPDQEINQIVKMFILQHSHERIIFDGVCRTVSQKEDFTKLMKHLDRDFRAIYIHISEKEAYDRLLGRRICSKCKTTYPASYKEDACSFILESGLICGGNLVKRQDDTDEESIKARLNAFFTKTSEAINSFRDDGKLIEIDGSKSIEEVTDEIQTKLFR